MRRQKLHPNAVLVGDRYRRELGPLDELTYSLTKDGQRQPIVVLDDMTLLAGERRLEVARKLGWPTIDAVRVRTLAEAIEAFKADAESATGPGARALTLSERVAQVEPLHALYARERGPAPKGLTRTQRYQQSVEALLANLLGIGSTRYRAVRLAVLIARGQRPTKGRPVSDLDRTLAAAAIVEIDSGANAESVGSRLRVKLGYSRNSGVPRLPTDPDREEPTKSPRARAAKQAPSRRRTALLDDLSMAVHQLTTVAGRFDRLGRDDRWMAQHGNTPPMVRLALAEAVEKINAVQRQVPPPTTKDQSS